ncbi:MAG: hypothetical protein KAF91_19255 [Nostoc sp. TH1S01]|nr:hypothetical protein [Nostoc sp. TH1S01]
MSSKNKESKKATEAVKILGIVDFISSNEHLIDRKLEDCDVRVFQAQKRTVKMQSGDRYCMEGSECDMMFIADSLPIVTGIVHVGSTVKELNDAKKWVKSIVPDADPISVLSALTLLYVAEHGYEKYQPDNTFIEGAEDLGEDAKRNKVWERIYERVKRRFSSNGTNNGSNAVL